MTEFNLQQLIVRLIVVAFISSVTEISHAQESKELYIEISSNLPNSSAKSELLSLIEMTLQTQNITPIFIENYDGNQYGYFWEQNALHITLQSQRNELFVFITPYANMQLDTSPILEAVISSPIMFSVDLSEQQGKQFNDFILGMAEYAVHNCENASNRFEALRTEQTEEFAHPYVKNAIVFYQANCEIELKNYDHAKSLLESIVPSANDDLFYSVEAIINLAWIDYENGNIEMAFSALNNLVDALVNDERLYLQDIRILSKRAQFHELESDFNAALADINSAIIITNNPSTGYSLTTSAEHYTQRGQLYRNIYEWDNSLADFNTAIELAPDYADAYYERGLLYYSVLQTGQELREEALADFKTYLELAPEGEYADEAQEYVDSIESELQALNE